MRDLALARQQFFGGLGLLLASAGLFFLVLKPQYAALQQKQAVYQNPHTYHTGTLTPLPVIDNPTGPQWKTEILDPIHQISKQSHTVVVSIKGLPQSAVAVGTLPPVVQKVQVSVVANGTYAMLQQLMDGLLQRFPFMTLQGVAIQNPSQKPLPLHARPMLQGTFELDLYILSAP